MYQNEEDMTEYKVDVLNLGNFKVIKRIQKVNSNSNCLWNQQFWCYYADKNVIIFFIIQLKPLRETYEDF